MGWRNSTDSGRGGMLAHHSMVPVVVQTIGEMVDAEPHTQSVKATKARSGMTLRTWA
jgi:hypothetical protein